VAKILVIDDEFGIGELLRDLLTDEGHEVLLAINGRQGLEVMAQARPALVLLDFMMPVLDGAAVLKAMSANPALSQIPVILMSSLPEATINARTRGHTHYVRKPFRIEDILKLTAATLTSEEDPA
jgi:CheY-like chemotaxis protein